MSKSEESTVERVVELASREVRLVGGPGTVLWRWPRLQSKRVLIKSFTNELICGAGGPTQDAVLSDLDSPRVFT